MLVRADVAAIADGAVPPNPGASYNRARIDVAESPDLHVWSKLYIPLNAYTRTESDTVENEGRVNVTVRVPVLQPQQSQIVLEKRRYKLADSHLKYRTRTAWRFATRSEHVHQGKK